LQLRSCFFTTNWRYQCRRKVGLCKSVIVLFGMANHKGAKKVGGRAKGAVNKTTQEARAAIALFVDKNASKLDAWLSAVADGDPVNDIKPNPAKAFELFQSVVEYHVPKLARIEHTGEGGGPVVISATPLDERL
jgi:hypothetical protein